ncbi:hypothetical protein V5799_020871 [Amblyomma americanum]|uniref:Uncharacterized protein n=1 Tax=Amblyomma americanum TaxID=6943 RepID=A0AAQ4ET61_AMBAM
MSEKCNLHSRSVSQSGSIRSGLAAGSILQLCKAELRSPELFISSAVPLQVCYSELLAEDEQCLQGAVEFNKEGLRPSRDIQHFPSYEAMSEEPMADDSMPYGSLEAPIGWRTIQGEWFQEVRRRSSGYADL